MLQILKRLFGGGTASSESRPSESSTVGGPANGEADNVEGFVSYVVRALVDSPDKVTISSEEKDRATVIRVACEKQDIGKVIGRNGKTISAIRALANGAGGRVGKRINVEVMD